VLAAILLFGVLRITFSRTPLLAEGSLGAPLAFVCALVWLVHPLNSEAVNYRTQRTESLMGLFYLLTVYAAIRAGAAGAIWDMRSRCRCVLCRRVEGDGP